jgi:DNA-binding winged helix-turn-helix (wHTH) protein
VRFLFGDHALDTDTRELKFGFELIYLAPKVFDLLAYLVRNRERVVTKDDLLKFVWSGRNVSDSTLTSHINAVRKAIGDSGERQKQIRTVARKGFRFVGEVRKSRGRVLVHHRRTPPKTQGNEKTRTLGPRSRHRRCHLRTSHRLPFCRFKI